MANTVSIVGIDQAKGNEGAGYEMHAYQVAVQLSGGYATASKPSFDVLVALQNAHEGITAVTVQSAQVFRDLIDSSGNRYTAPDANISISGSVVTFRVDSTDSTHNNGIQNTEVADSTALNGVFVFLVRATTTPA